MKKKSSQSAFLNLRVLIGLFVFMAGVFLALVGFGTFSNVFAQNDDKSGITRQDLVGMYQALAPATFVPPPCVAGSEMFNDVPADNPFCPWVEELARQGITGGCGGGNFCPGASVTRAQMAVFIVRTAAGGPVASANVAADGTVRNSFNRFGGEPTVSHTAGTGFYILTFPGLEGQVAFNNATALVSLNSGTGQIRRDSTGGNAVVQTSNSTGVATDFGFEIVVFVPGAL